jgi:hypothetical protein
VTDYRKHSSGRKGVAVDELRPLEGDMAIDLTIHSVGSGICSLSGKDCEGVTVSFKDGTVTESFLSQKSFIQLLRMKAAKKPEAPKLDVPRATVAVPQNGVVVAAK